MQNTCFIRWLLALLVLPMAANAQVSFTRTIAVEELGGWGLSAAEGPDGPSFSFYKSGGGGLAYGSRVGHRNN